MSTHEKGVVTGKVTCVNYIKSLHLIVFGSEHGYVTIVSPK